MAADVADWTQAVNVTGGSVSITGIATVTISGTPAVTISGTPTVQFAAGQTVGITGTVTVSISAGSVSINGVPTINITQASGLAMTSPSLLPLALNGPITAGWVIDTGITAIAFNADGTMTLTAGGEPFAQAVRATTITGQYAVPRCVAGQVFQFSFTVKALDHAVNAVAYISWLDATGTQIAFAGSAAVAEVLNSYVTVTVSATAPAGAFFVGVKIAPDAGGTGTNADRYVIGSASLTQVGAVSIAGIVQVAGAVSSNPSTTLSASAASGQAKATVVNPSIFFPGAVVQLVSLSGGSNFLGIVKSVNSDSSITLTANLTASFVAGDAALVLPEQLATSRKRAWDWTGVQAAAQGVAPAITIAAVTGQRLIANGWLAVIINTNAAAATGTNMEIKDNNSLGTVLWASYTGVTGNTGDKDRISEQDLGVPGVVGNALWIGSGAGIANASQSISAGGYTAIAEPI